jgi:hypothetical protein
MGTNLNICDSGSATKKINKCDNNFTGWDGAIADAKKCIRQLENAIDFFERRKAAGEPWPGENNAIPS